MTKIEEDTPIFICSPHQSTPILDWQSWTCNCTARHAFCHRPSYSGAGRGAPVCNAKTLACILVPRQTGGQSPPAGGAPAQPWLQALLPLSCLMTFNFGLGSLLALLCTFLFEGTPAAPSAYSRLPVQTSEWGTPKSPNRQARKSKLHTFHFF